MSIFLLDEKNQSSIRRAHRTDEARLEMLIDEFEECGEFCWREGIVVGGSTGESGVRVGEDIGDTRAGVDVKSESRPE